MKLLFWHNIQGPTLSSETVQIGFMFSALEFYMNFQLSTRWLFEALVCLSDIREMIACAVDVS